MLEILAVILGVAIGGGIKAFEDHRARVREAEVVLSALVSEVEALTRMAEHRQYLPALRALQHHAEGLIENGHADASCIFVQFTVSDRMFAAYDASLEKIGVLPAYQADRIVRFYTFARAFIENYGPSSPFRGDVSAREVAAVCQNDAEVVTVLLALGNEIAGFRTLPPPPEGSVIAQIAAREAPDNPSAVA